MPFAKFGAILSIRLETDKMAQGIANRIGNYMHADGAARRYKIGSNVYVIGIAGAYNAYGLIGSEHNGIFILDDTNKEVILDRHMPISSGYNGPSKEQWAEFGRIANLEFAAFKNFCKNHPRFRGDFGQ